MQGMNQTDTKAGHAHRVDTYHDCEPWHMPGGQDPNWPPRPHRALNRDLLLSSGAVQAPVRRPLWRRLLRALGVRA